MDLLTQGLLGGALSLSASPRRHARLATGIGFAAALLADADVLIGSGDDSLLQLEYHRHFTHALVFIPLGALIAAALIWPLSRRRMAFATVYLYALLGYATAGVLDACTSYGTHLLWPFSETRIAWSVISIVDPVFSLALLGGVVVGWRSRRPGPARVGLALAGCYLLVGLWQHHNALDSARALAERRGHEVERLIVKPTIANLLLWRSIYLANDRFHVDAIRVAPSGERIYPGGTAAAFSVDRDLPSLTGDNTLGRDIRRFVALSDGFVAPDPARAGVLIDIRYSMLPTSVEPMWGLDMNTASATRHAQFRLYRDRPDNMRSVFIAMLLGRELPD